MLEDPNDQAPQTLPSEVEDSKIPPLAVLAVLIVAMLIVTAVGISIIKVDKTSMHRISWSAGDEVNYTGTSIAGDLTSELNIRCTSPSTDLDHPGFGMRFYHGFNQPLSVFEDKQPFPYDLRDSRGNIVAQAQIETAFGMKWVDIWTTGTSFDNGMAYQMAILTVSVGHNTGLVYEASFMTEGAEAHVRIANSTNEELWQADLELRDKIICGGASVVKEDGNPLRFIGGNGWMIGTVIIKEGEALRYEIEGNDMFMHIFSPQDLVGVASGDFSYNKTLSLLTGTSGAVNVCPPPGVYYVFLEMQGGTEANQVTMYWN